MLTEDSPVNLLNRFQVNSIEKLYLKLSLQSMTSSIPNSQPPENQPLSIMDKKILNYKNKSSIGGKISALITMNFIKIRRNPTFVFLMICLPILQISVFCNTIGLEPKSLQFGVINEENCTNQNTEECGLESMYSCRILDQLDENVIFKIQNYLNETDSFCRIKILCFHFTLLVFCIYILLETVSD